MSPRTKTLLLDVAKQFDDASAVMHHDWLVEHKVSADEVFDLCNKLGFIIKGFVLAPKDMQTIILACGASTDDKMAEMFTRVLSRDHAMKSVLARLKDINEKTQEG